MIQTLILILVLLDATCLRRGVAARGLQGDLTGHSPLPALHKGHHEHGGDATDAERRLLPHVDDDTRAETAARFEALLSPPPEDAAVGGPENRGVLGTIASFAMRRNEKERASKMTPLESVTSRYMSNEEVYLHLRDFAERCGEISRVVRIGTSVQGVPIEALEISNTLEDGLKDGKPHAKMVGTIHGDETSGLSTTLGVAEWLCANYKTDPEAKEIVSKVHLWVLPVMNPDGYAMKTRYNANGKDLNRDFPDQFKGGMCMCPDGREPETRAIMEWTEKYPFVSSLVFHEGALVVNYPLDGTPSGQSRYMACADDETFIHIAHVYADNHPILRAIRQREFADGITNGASWYVIYGGMQDWNYLQGEAMELTIEISERKTPPASELPKIYEQNKQSILEYIKATVTNAVQGRVTTTGSKGQVGVKGATVSIKGIDSSVTTRDGGYFTRPLAPGKYTAVVEKKGYKPVEKDVVVGASGTPDVIDIVLEPASEGGKKKKKKGDTKKETDQKHKGKKDKKNKN